MALIPKVSTPLRGTPPPSTLPGMLPKLRGAASPSILPWVPQKLQGAPPTSVFLGVLPILLKFRGYPKNSRGRPRPWYFQGRL